MTPQRAARFAAAVLLGAALGVSLRWWVERNPAGRFGICRHGFIVYNRIPFPVVDVLVGANGWPAVRSGTAHVLRLDEFRGFIPEARERWPDLVIIGAGTQSKLKVDEVIFEAYPGLNIVITSSAEAATVYNLYRDGGMTVAAILHSTH